MANPHTTSSELTNTTTTAHHWHPGQHILRARNGPRTLEAFRIVQHFQKHNYRCKTWKGVHEKQNLFNLAPSYLHSYINREGIMPGGRSTVDESLFANKDSKKSNRGPAAPAAGLVISRGELAKIKQMGVIETYSQKQERAAKARAAREAKMQKAQLRKKRMIEKEKEAKKHRVKSDIEIIKEAEANALLNNASKMMEENEDAVKEMNRMVLYAQCVAVRDKQLEDKKQRAEKAKEENRLIDLRSEIERLKALQREEAVRKREACAHEGRCKSHNSAKSGKRKETYA